MAKFRKKPVVIEAWEVRELLRLAAHDWYNLPERIRKAYDKVEVVFASDSIHVHTLEGVMVAGKDWWIIQGVKGELYPCEDEIFKATYEAVVKEFQT